MRYRFSGVLSLAVVSVLALPVPTNAAVITTSTIAPTVNAYDEANLVATTASLKWFADIEHDAGQTFTPSVTAQLNSFTVQLHRSNQDEGGEWVNVRLGNITRPGGAFTFTDFYSETAVMNGDWNAEDYLTFTFNTPQTLTGGMEYGVIIDAQNFGDWHNGIPYIKKPGGYAGGHHIGRGGQGNSDLAFLASLEVAGGGGGEIPVVLPTIANPSFETDANLFTAAPGYVGGSNPAEITSWPGSGNRGINPGATGSAPFRNNGNNNTNVAFLQSVGSIANTISSFEVGEQYRIAFGYNARTGNDPDMTATIGGATLTDTSIPSVGGSNSYYAGNLVFTAANTTETLTISQTVGGDTTLLVDNVRVFRNGPTIADNGFENPVQPNNNWKQANGAGGGDLTGSAWTITGAAGITRNISAFQAGGIRAPEGDQHAMLQSTGSFSQTISGFEVGAEYTFSLLTMARQHAAFGNDLEAVLDAGLASEILLLDIPEVIFPSFTEQVSPWFLAEKGSYELTIRSTLDGGNLTGDRTTFFDNLWFNQQTVPIPEPSTLALAVSSLLGLGFFGRRRRRR